MEKVQHKWAFIVNPQSGKNKKGKFYQKLCKELTRQGISFELALTEKAGHLPQLFQQLAAQGYRQFIVSGGDGTLGETVNALHHQRVANPLDFTFAFMPSGTGNDWAKTMEMPKKVAHLVNLISAGNIIQQDVGKVSFTNKNGEAQQHYFVNVAGSGFDTFLSEHYLTGDNNIGVLNFYLQTVKGLFKYENQPYKIEYETEVGNTKVIESNMFMLAFGVCKFFGGGMKITPNASPTAGLIDITVIKDVTTKEAFSQLPRIPSGKFISYHKVETATTKKLKLSSANRQLIQADGEIICSLPAEIEIVTKGLNVIVPSGLKF